MCAWLFWSNLEAVWSDVIALRERDDDDIDDDDDDDDWAVKWLAAKTSKHKATLSESAGVSEYSLILVASDPTLPYSTLKYPWGREKEGDVEAFSAGLNSHFSS